jgi:hypothetical protein
LSNLRRINTQFGRENLFIHESYGCTCNAGAR